VVKHLQLAEGFKIPLEALEDVVAILGRRGRGKTTTATVIVEELHAAGARFCVADPTGVWWGLKSSRDGKRPGIPVVVMGGEPGGHGDVPLAVQIKAASGAAATRPSPVVTVQTARTPRPPAAPARGGAGDARLGSGERAVLTAVCQYPAGAARDQLTVLTGYKRSSRRPAWSSRAGASCSGPTRP
jgi:hypothetical protein